ncbi:MAG: MFS transporter [Chloroflexi bacterium]|nr:MFS transporter [Chloroflexota bacterium]
MTNEEEKRPIRPFLAIWTGQSISLLGSSLVSFALIWWLTEESGSATVLALASIVTIIPRVLLSPIIGTLVDRWPRGRIMLISDISIAFTTMVMALFFALDIKEITLVYLLMFIRGLGGAFHGPAMIVSTTLMVPEKHYSRIAGLNNALRGAMSILAPLMGALLLSVLPLQSILALDVITALPAIIPLLFITIPQPTESQPAQTTPRPSVWRELRQGLRYIVRWPGLMMLIGVYAMVHFLLAPALAFMPLLVTDHFAGGALQLASLQSAAGIGLVIGGLALGLWGGLKRRMATAMIALALMGVGMISIGLAPSAAFPIAVVGMFTVGFTLSFVTSLRLAVLQTAILPELQGRVITVVLSSTALTDPIGLAIAGPLSDTVGVRIWYIVCGIITIVMGIGALFVPAIINIEKESHPIPTAV